MIFNFRPIGINIGSSSDITIDGNVVAHIQQRTTLEFSGVMDDKEGGIFSCTFYSETEACSNILITNNIVAGTFWVGYTIYGHRCGGTMTNTGNVAHSINRSSGGVGFAVIPEPTDSKQTT